MNSINLLQYVRNWLFLKNLEQENPFDLIIFEKFDNDEINLNSNIKIHTLENMKYDFGISWIISSLADKHKNILFVIDEINSIYLLPLLNLSKNNITIINLWSWISSYINKDLPETKDIWILSNFDIKIYEPFDLKSFFEILKLWWSKYIRTDDKELPLNVFDQSEIQIDYKDWIISMIEYGFSGGEWTVVLAGSMTIESILSMDICQKKWVFFDLFILYWYNFKITNELKNSILKTEKISIVLEQNKDCIYENVIKAKLWESWLFETEINFIYPNFEKISTNLKDYIFEQAEFDSNDIAQALLDK